MGDVEGDEGDVENGENGESGAGVLDVADRLPKGGWSADLLAAAPAAPGALVEAVSEPFGAGGGADVLIILILSPRTQAFSNVQTYAPHERSVPRQKILARGKSHISLVNRVFPGLFFRARV